MNVKKQNPHQGEMSMNLKAVGLGVIVAVILVIVAVSIVKGPLPVQEENTGNEGFISLPPGFKAEVYADNVPGARSIATGDLGTIFVGTRDHGTVYALRDTDGDGYSDRQWTVAEGLFMPNGVAFKDGSLYVAEVDKVLRYDDIENSLDEPPEPVVVYSDLPSETSHGWKFIRFGPDGMLYIPVGMPCNICEPTENIYGTITRMNPDGTGFEVYADGVRNSVGFDWNPGTGDLWFTDNGRDWLGDDLPPDELNRAPAAGMSFGFPYYYGDNIEDPDYAGSNKPAGTPPVLGLPAHVAPLGIRFYTGSMFPEEYASRIFIAEHGSWNSNTPVGYQVVTVDPDSVTPEAVPFAAGFLDSSGEVKGRPVDLEILPDGSMLLSDDLGGKIYRITYGE